MTHKTVCIKCGRSDAAGEWVGPDGELMGTCHGTGRPEHPGRRVTWNIATGKEHRPGDPQTHKFGEVFRRGTSYAFRGFPADFLHTRCQVVLTTALDLGDIFGKEFGLHEWAQEREDNGFVISALPFRSGTKVCGIQFRAFSAKTGDAEGGHENTRNIGKDGVYAPLKPGNNVEAAVLHEGPWGAIAQLFDAKEYGASNIGAIAVASAGTAPETVTVTCNYLLPGIPIFILADNDEAGLGMRNRLGGLGTLISLPPVGDGKDYRDLSSDFRYEALVKVIYRHLRDQEKSPGAGSPITTEELDCRLAKLLRTEFGLAERFIHRHGVNCGFVEAWGKWLVYNGKIWEPSSLKASLYAQLTIKALLREARFLD